MSFEYAWLNAPSHASLGTAFCFSFVRAVAPPELLRRFGADPAVARPMTLPEAAELQRSPSAGFPDVVVVVSAGPWTLAVEPNGYLGSLPEVLRLLSVGTEAVSVFRNVNAVGSFGLAVDGRIVTQFDQREPGHRWGDDPDRLLPLMREVGLDPEPSHGRPVAADAAALALAERLTGIRLDPGLLGGVLLGAVASIPSGP